MDQTRPLTHPMGLPPIHGSVRDPSENSSILERYGVCVPSYILDFFWQNRRVLAPCTSPSGVAHRLRNMAHASQPRHANTRRISVRARRRRHLKGHTFGTTSPEKTLHKVRPRPCWSRASNRNVRHTSFDLRSFATLTDASCVKSCQFSGKLHHRRHVNRASLD